MFRTKFNKFVIKTSEKPKHIVPSNAWPSKAEGSMNSNSVADAQSRNSSDSNAFGQNSENDKERVNNVKLVYWFN